MRRFKYIIISLITILSAFNLQAQLCQDYLVLANGEDIVRFGMDTTKHWWAITTPFEKQFRLVIDGEEMEVYDKLTKPIFSPDGEKWACFGEYAGGWYLMDQDSTSDLYADKVGDMVFSPNSKHLAYSYANSTMETIACGDKKIEVSNRSGNIFVSNSGKFAFTGKRSDSWVINIDGKESTLYEEIKPIGFWNDDKFIYAAKNGNSWVLYKNDKVISEQYSQINEVKINLAGDVFAILATYRSDYKVGVIFSDEYSEPLVSSEYENISYLDLHPTAPLICFRAFKQHNYVIVCNNVEYDAGTQCSPPKFSFDGEDVFYFSCGSFDCYAGISGRKYNIPLRISTQMTYAMKPGSKTLAYSTSSSMVVLSIETKTQHAGKMMDQLIYPRYNRFENRYETIGRIRNRLYLMTCGF